MSKQGEVELTWYDSDTEEEVTHTFPSKNEVCPRCEGFGCHLNPSIGNYAYTPEEFNEAFFEDEDKEQYFTRGGIYDVTCETCKGNKVVPVVDESRLNDEQKKLFASYEEAEEERASEERADARIRYMESGGYDY